MTLHGTRKLIEFADWAGVDGVEAKLLRRVDVYCRRHGLALLSYKFRRGSIEKCAAVICTIVVEQADARALG